MWIDRLVDSRTTRAAGLAASFAEARHNVLAQNLANVNTPDYHTQTLDPRAFQKSLSEALDRVRESDAAPLDLRGDAQFSTTSSGKIAAKPTVDSAPNVLFHDGTNARLESLISDTNETTLYYEVSMNFLRNSYQNVLNAIRGKVA